MNIEESIKYQELNAQEEIDKLNLMKSIDFSKPITEDYFHELCETPLRYDNNFMCECVKQIFPMSTDITNRCNYVVFNINGFIVHLPNSRSRGVEIEIESIPKVSTIDYSADNKIKWLQEYIELIDTKASWYVKAQKRNGNNFRKWVLPFWYFFHIIPKDNKEKRNRNWYQNQLDELIKNKQQSIERQQEKYNQFIDKWRIYLEEVKPILLTFTQNIRGYNSPWYSKDFFEEIRNIIK